MSKQEMLRKLAELETINDQLATEISSLDALMRSVGFSDGIHTVKATAQELYEREISEDEEAV